MYFMFGLMLLYRLFIFQHLLFFLFLLLCLITFYFLLAVWINEINSGAKFRNFVAFFVYFPVLLLVMAYSSVPAGNGPARRAFRKASGPFVE